MVKMALSAIAAAAEQGSGWVVCSLQVGAVPSVQRAEIARAYAKPTENLDAYDLYLRALERFHARSQSGLEEALTLLERAIRLDPDYAPREGTIWTGCCLA